MIGAARFETAHARADDRTLAAFALMPLLCRPTHRARNAAPVAVVIFGGLVIRHCLDTVLTPVDVWALGREANCNGLLAQRASESSEPPRLKEKQQMKVWALKEPLRGLLLKFATRPPSHTTTRTSPR